jgi:uncharacterized membrane protein
MAEAVKQYEPTQDERTMATLAHALQVVAGWIPPLVILLIKRDSKFVSFHALQALLFQVLFILFWIFFMVLWFMLIFTTVFSTAANSPRGQPPAGIFLAFPLIWLFAMGGWILVLVLAIVYAIKAGRGEWADYPLVGGLARRILHIQ